jgi:hypothetical protein
VAQHFDDLVRDIDLQVESDLADTQTQAEQLKINERRDECLRAIRDYCEQVNMRHLNANGINRPVSTANGHIDSLLVEFCHVIEYNRVQRVLLTDTFVLKRALEKFATLLQLSSSSSMDRHRRETRREHVDETHLKVSFLFERAPGQCE